MLEADPALLPLMSWYRARMLIHDLIEHGNIQKIPEIREAYLKEAKTCLLRAAEAYPNNRLMGMYLGDHIPWETELIPDPQAPDWANHQRDLLHRLTYILHWWVKERQLPDGQYGGGWGDDVEMWRQWIPILIGMEDPLLIEAQEKLSEGLFATEHMQAGYTNRIYDVEHTAEDSADTITPMMHLKPGDEGWKARAMRILELMETKWTGRNERGMLQFKSTYFSSEEVDPSPERACDTVYHPRTIQSALLLWQRTGNERIGKIVLDWMDTWVEATERAERGKAAGIIPSAIHWPDGGIGGLREEWWIPGNHDSDPLYTWPSAMTMMLNTLLLSFYMSQKKKYLEPIFSMTRMYRAHKDKEVEVAPEPGSAAWCASQMGSFLPGILAKYRKLSGDSQFDDLIKSEGNAYSRLYFSNDRKALSKEMAEQAEAFHYNLPAFTSEVYWTDRVFRFHRSYLNAIADAPIPSYDANFLFSCLTGNIGNALYFPMNAIRWLTQPSDFAALVLLAESNSFRAEIFHFGTQPREMSAELYLLSPGSYVFQVRNAQTTEVLLTQSLNISHTPYRLSFELPVRTLCVFEVQ